MIHTKKQGRTL